jgi:hypothetical protein
MVLYKLILQLCNNTAVGYNALTANTTGASNAAVGDVALDITTTGT